jgi:hypothetical protein
MPPRSTSIEARKLALRDLLRHRRDGAKTAGVSRCALKHSAIVDTMNARLHEDAAFDAKDIVKRQQTLDWIVGRGVCARRLIGEVRAVEDMGVAIASEAWERHRGATGIRVRCRACRD